MEPSVPTFRAVLEVIDTLGSPGAPWTAAEVAARLDCTPKALSDRLDALVDDGLLDTRTLGSGERVWWQPPAALRADDRTAEHERRAATVGLEYDDSALDDELDIAIYTLDADFRLTSLNEQAEVWLGTTEAAVRGERLWDVFERDETADDAFHEARDTQEITHFLTFYEPWERWFDNWVAPSNSGLTVYFTDVTKRKRVEQVLRRLRDRLHVALNAARMGTWEWNLADRTVSGDPRFMAFFDIPPTDRPLPVERFLEKMSAESAAQCETAMDTDFEPGDEVQNELSIEHVSGAPTWILWRGHAARNDPSKVIGVSFDITEQKQREQRLEAQREQLKRQNSRLREFTDSLSHDLRNPLSVIGGRLTLYWETGDTEHLECIEATTARMEQLVDDLLRVARHGQVVEATDAVDVATVLAATRGGTLRKRTECTYDPIPPLMADPDRLVQMFENLLQNSVEHGGEGVSIRVGPLEDGFYVEDDGPGIPEADQEHVFDHGYALRDGGTGYGLSIVQAIADAHHWDVSVTDSTEGGARFEITGVEFAPRQ